MIEAGLILSRFLHYVATTFLFGATLYPVYSFAGDIPQPFGQTLKRGLVAATALAVLSLVNWFLFAAAGMAGDASAMLDPTVLATIVTSMSFGKLWVLRLVLCVPLAALVLGWPSKASVRVLPILSALLLLSLAGTGHAGEPDGSAVIWHVVSDGIHLLAAGAWLGALWPLFVALKPSLPNNQTGDLLARFSVIGQIAVALLLLSGVINSWFLVGSFGQLFGSFYGQVLCVKIGLLFVMLGFAAVNRFHLTPQFTTLSRAEPSVKQLRRHILAEQALGLLVLAVVSWIGTLQPPMAS